MKILSYILCFLLLFVWERISFAQINATLADNMQNTISLIVFVLLSHIFFVTEVINKKGRILINLVFFILFVVIYFYYLNDTGARFGKLMILNFVFYNVRGVLHRNMFVRILKVLISVPLVFFLFSDNPFQWAVYFKPVFWMIIIIDFSLYLVMKIFGKKNNVKPSNEDKDDAF